MSWEPRPHEAGPLAVSPPVTPQGTVGIPEPGWQQGKESGTDVKGVRGQRGVQATSLILLSSLLHSFNHSFTQKAHLAGSWAVPRDAHRPGGGTEGSLGVGTGQVAWARLGGRGGRQRRGQQGGSPPCGAEPEGSRPAVGLALPCQWPGAAAAARRLCRALVRRLWGVKLPSVSRWRNSHLAPREIWKQDVGALATLARVCTRLSFSF